ncbi:hypothetical protein FE783_15885 [Paenibacillus mesophilus]|uniref:alanine racemase n=1 Tax=Paenibacillus mesophilus TaxID=2582849 RepID=UPI00110D3335|nr:alanine racemase [Paenibacillus mesophilus]TMV49142.1 hypothetical protein FE783_15885 [Paenibacillus mesophilus]
MDKGQLDTPFVLVDLDKTEQNIAAYQAVADRCGVKLRPHAKTHKIPQLARMQIAAGAVGVTVAKVGEAEVMADAGIPDIMVAYPVVGEAKLARLARLAQKSRITVAVDSEEAAIPLAEAMTAAGASVDVLIELDCGFGRVGLQPGEPLLHLARRLVGLTGLRMTGILAFAGQAYDAPDEVRLREIAAHEAGMAAEAARLLRNNGIPAHTVSVGSTPSSRYAAEGVGVTEIRPGAYVFGDLMQVDIGAHRLEQCALTVKVTVVSRPSTDRAVIDAGTKVFTMDGNPSSLGTGRGWVVGHPGISVEWFTEEHGMLRLAPEEQSLRVGDTLEIVPVHCCGDVNMVDEVAAVRGDCVEAIWPVAARGKVR